jgi:hypothetical protein
MQRTVSIAAALVLAAALFTGCTRSKVDSRVRVVADAGHVPQIAKSVNGSKMWQTYFKEMAPDKDSAVVQVSLEVERKQFKSFGGDYDPGKVVFDFKVLNLKTGKELFEKDGEVDLDSFMFTTADADAAREKIQEIAFKATEEKVYPYMDRWINLAAIRAMGNSDKRVFEGPLEQLMDEKWTSADMRNEAAFALEKIRG